jgi:hypothetical protein
MLNDFCRVFNGLLCVGNRRFGSSPLWQIRPKQTLHRFRVEHGGHQRLTELVREGRRQRPGFRRSIEMHHLNQPLSGASDIVPKPLDRETAQYSRQVAVPH